MVMFLLKPIVVVWAGLNVLDDLSSVMKLTRLVGASIPVFRRDETAENMCDLCDDVVAGLMRGSEGLQAVPCSWLCLRIPKCMHMCEHLQDVSATSTKFPCVAAGYCTDEDYDGSSRGMDAPALTDMECEKGPLWSCEPRKYCRRRRQRLSYTCELRPGIGRWVGMQRAAATHTAALAAGLLSQKNCGEPGAGPFCIAAASGTGKVAHIVGGLLTIFYGGYQSIVAIETTGGADDRQWLTFWIIAVGSMFLEGVFARVLLSKFPFYYEVKLILILWLMFFDGANYCYRKVRKVLSRWSSYFAVIMDHGSHEAAQRQLDILIDIGGQFVTDQLAILEGNVKRNPAQRNSILMNQASLRVIGQLQQAMLLEEEEEESTLTPWEYDYTDTSLNGGAVKQDTTEKLFDLSRWLLSAEGLQEMENKKVSADIVAMLLERAAALLSFQPRFLHIHLIGTTPGVGKLPVMDRNGQADCYVKFRVLPIGFLDRKEQQTPNYDMEEVRSKIAYMSLEPVWNEKLEIQMKGGRMDSDGNYRNDESRHAVLSVEAWDADVGAWGIGYEVFKLLYYSLICVVLIAHVTGELDRFVSSDGLGTGNVRDFLILASGALLVLGFSLCYLKAVIWRSDDEFIGTCEVPLEMLLDQRQHSLCLTLQNPNIRKNETCGILRVKLSLSE